MDLVGRLVVGRDLREVDEVLRPLCYLLSEGGVVVGLETAEGREFGTFQRGVTLLYNMLRVFQQNVLHST